MAQIKQHTKEETKSNIFEHSQAKLALFRAYLWRYLTVLLNDPHTKKIYLYDVFCGIGIYEDGGKGSPLIALEIIKQMREKHPLKEVLLIVNDVDTNKINSIKRIVEQDFKDVENLVSYHNLDAVQMLELVVVNIKKTTPAEKNLVFIDPYGYKEIYKSNILSIMQSGRSEIILFLPISNMYRFSKVAVSTEENASYTHLRRFINDFFHFEHPICEGDFNHQLEYIDYIKQALDFDKEYYSAKFAIQRDTKNYYSLFFITSHIYGLDKMIEVKWKLDEDFGQGYEKPKATHLFSDDFKKENQGDFYQKFENKLIDFLREYKTNNEIYEFGLREEFSPKKVKETMEKLIEKLQFENNFKPRKNSYLLSYTYWKEKDVRYRVKIK